MDTVIRAAVVGLVAVAAVLAIKKDNPAGAYLLGLAALAAIATAAAGIFAPVLAFLEELAESARLSRELLTSLVKILVIGVTAHIAAEACRDAGEKAIGGCVEFAGSAAALYASLPLVSAVFSFLRTFSP